MKWINANSLPIAVNGRLLLIYRAVAVIVAFYEPEVCVIEIELLVSQRFVWLKINAFERDLDHPYILLRLRFGTLNIKRVIVSDLALDDHSLGGVILRPQLAFIRDNTIFFILLRCLIIARRTVEPARLVRVGVLIHGLPIKNVLNQQRLLSIQISRPVILLPIITNR